MLAAADPTSLHRQALIQRARQSVLLGAGGEASLEPWITRSWQRCLAAGLHPGQKVVFNPISGQALRQLADESHALVQAARPVLDQLTRAIAGMRYFAMLTNARGVVIDVQGAVDRHDPLAAQTGIEERVRDWQQTLCSPHLPQGAPTSPALATSIWAPSREALSWIFPAQETSVSLP